MSDRKLRIYLDLDGTILDVKARYHVVYTRLIDELGGEAMPLETFWQLRRQGISTQSILGDLDEGKRLEFAQRWLELIETPPHLALDCLLPGAYDALARLREEVSLVLVTLRRNRDALFQQLQSLGIEELFDTVLSGASEDGDIPAKATLILDGAPFGSVATLIVGDSEADVAAARHLCQPVVCVDSGIRNRAFLECLRPDFILDSLADLPDLITWDGYIYTSGLAKTIKIFREQRGGRG